MKKRLIFWLGFLAGAIALVCIAANPSFTSFNSTQFGTNVTSPNVISIISGASTTNFHVIGNLSKDGTNMWPVIYQAGAPGGVVVGFSGVFYQDINNNNVYLFEGANGSTTGWVLIGPSSGGSQTPWTNTINGAGNSLTNVNQITNVTSISATTLFVSPDGGASAPGIQMSGNGGVTFDFGNTQNQSSDAQLRLRAPPWTTLSGISAYLTGTNPSGGILYGQSGTTNMYYYDPFALSIGSTPMQAVHSDLPGVSQIVMNGEPFAITSTSTGVGGTPGNYASLWISPTNNRVYFPKFTSGKLYPTGVNLGGSNFPSDGGPIAFTVETDTGNADVTNDLHFGGLLFSGSSQKQITEGTGFLNVGGFDNTQTGTMTVNSATVACSNLTTENGGHSLSGPMSIALQSSGIGFNWNNGSALLQCGWQGTELWNVGSATGPWNFDTGITIGGVISKYNTEATAGVGVPYSIGQAVVIGTGANIGATSFLTNGASVGTYVLYGSINATSVGAGTNVTLTITGTDAASTAISTNILNAVTFAGSATKNFAPISFTIKASTQLSYAVTFSGTVGLSYDVRIYAYRVGNN